MKYWDGKKKTARQAYQADQYFFHNGGQTNPKVPFITKNSFIKLFLLYISFFFSYTVDVHNSLNFTRATCAEIKNIFKVMSF